MKPLAAIICDFIEINFPEVRATFVRFDPDAYINMKYDYCGRKADKYVKLKGHRLGLCDRPEMVIDFHDPESFNKLKERLDWCINYDCHECMDSMDHIKIRFTLGKGVKLLEEKETITKSTMKLWFHTIQDAS